MTTRTFTTTEHHSLAPELFREIERTRKNCSQCGSCVNECPFLSRFGNPADQATNDNQTLPELLARAFKCTLCGLCTKVCPDGVDPSRMFLHMRREAFSRGLADLPEHRGMRAFERIGNSKSFSWYALPQRCETIFFPGCALVGTHSATVGKVFDHLRRIVPFLGIVLDCCNKPSHDLGNIDHFQFMFTEMHDYFIEHRVKNILVACPNCFRMFKQYAPDLTTRTIYEVLAEHQLPEAGQTEITATIHDPCVIRNSTAPQQAVRRLLSAAGVQFKEMPHSQGRTLCCGEGGGAGCSAPDLARQWIDKRLNEAQGRPLVSYCAGCINSYSPHTTTIHVLDLIFDPNTVLTQRKNTTRPPITYIKRLAFKRSLQRSFPTAVIRERTRNWPATQSARSFTVNIAAIAALLTGTVIAYRFFSIW